jgi:hypothetical protein
MLEKFSHREVLQERWFLREERRPSHEIFWRALSMREIRKGTLWKTKNARNMSSNYQRGVKEEKLRISIINESN